MPIVLCAGSFVSTVENCVSKTFLAFNTAIASPFLRGPGLRFWIPSSSSVASRFQMWLNSTFNLNPKFASLGSAFQSLGFCVSRVSRLAFKGRDVF